MIGRRDFTAITRATGIGGSRDTGQSEVIASQSRCPTTVDLSLTIPTGVSQSQIIVFYLAAAHRSVHL